MDRREFFFWTITATGGLAGKKAFVSSITLTDEQMAEIVHDHPGTVLCHCLNIVGVVHEQGRKHNFPPAKNASSMEPEYSWDSLKGGQHPVDHVFTLSDRHSSSHAASGLVRTYRRRKHLEGPKVIVRVTCDENDELMVSSLDLSDPQVKMLGLRGETPQHFGRVEGKWAELS